MQSIKGMRNRSSATSRGDQQVLAAEGCGYAAAFKLAKRHDKHLYFNTYEKYLSTSPYITVSVKILRGKITSIVSIGRDMAISTKTGCNSDILLVNRKVRARTHRMTYLQHFHSAFSQDWDQHQTANI